MKGFRHGMMQGCGYGMNQGCYGCCCCGFCEVSKEDKIKMLEEMKKTLDLKKDHIDKMLEEMKKEE